MAGWHCLIQKKFHTLLRRSLAVANLRETDFGVCVADFEPPKALITERRMTITEGWAENNPRAYTLKFVTGRGSEMRQICAPCL